MKSVSTSVAYPEYGAYHVDSWRRGWESNPPCYRSQDFESRCGTSREAPPLSTLTELMGWPDRSLRPTCPEGLVDHPYRYDPLDQDSVIDRHLNHRSRPDLRRDRPRSDLRCLRHRPDRVDRDSGHPVLRDGLHQFVEESRDSESPNPVRRVQREPPWTSPASPLVPSITSLDMTRLQLFDIDRQHKAPVCLTARARLRTRPRRRSHFYRTTTTVFLQRRYVHLPLRLDSW